MTLLNRSLDSAELRTTLDLGEPGTYAAVDGAAYPELLARLDAASAEYRCLFFGEIAAAVRAVAPHLVALREGCEFTRELLESAFAGVRRDTFTLIGAEADLGVVYRHLRKHQRIEIEPGRWALFRYYDPRVLRDWLPALAPEEAGDFFGPVSRFVCASVDDGSWLEFSRASPSLASSGST